MINKKIAGVKIIANNIINNTESVDRENISFKNNSETIITHTTYKKPIQFLLPLRNNISLSESILIPPVLKYNILLIK
jgi:hypothetical protein